MREGGSFSLLAKSTLQQLGQREEEVARTMSYPPSGSGQSKEKNIASLLKRKKNFQGTVLKILAISKNQK